MLLFWFVKICSSMENIHIEVEHLGSSSKCYNYPANIIDQCIKFFLDKSDVPEQTAPAVSKKELLAVFSFLGNYSMNLKARLYKSVSKTSVQCNIKVIFQSENRLSSYFKFKDSIFLYLHYHLIYNFRCNNCNISY